MPFEVLEKRVSTRADEYPATIRLRTSAAKTCCYVTLKSALLGEPAWPHGTKLAVAIGSGDDAGKMRLIKRATGTFVLNKAGRGGMASRIDLGHIAQFGDKDTSKIGIEARKVDKDTIEVDLPNFAEHLDDGTDDEQEEDLPRALPAPEQRRLVDEHDEKPLHIPLRSAAAAAPAPARQETAGVTAVEHSGVRVTGGAKPMITHQGERLDLTPRQARLMAMLVKVLGSMLPTAALIQKIGLTASAGAAQISDDYFALKEPLADLGLRLTFTPKMGYTLAKA